MRNGKKMSSLRIACTRKRIGIRGKYFVEEIHSLKQNGAKEDFASRKLEPNAKTPAIIFV